MRFEFSEEQRQFQRSLRELLTREYRAREKNPQIWSKLAEIGVLGAAVPESAGGLGGGPLDWILLAEEAGRAALNEPLTDAFAVAPELDPASQAALAEGRLKPSAARIINIGGGAGFDRMALASAAELVGLGQHLIDLTVEYVKVRQQFGAPVGSFQAVKHQLANALLAVEFARPFVYRAAYQLSPVNVSMAKAAASDAAHLATRISLQCHGAIGYSYEHDLPIWMKRVWALEPAWGSARWHRERIARAILDGEYDEPSLSG